MSSAMCWKNVDVVRPHPGHAVTCGVKLRRPSDCRICCATSTSSVRSPFGFGVSDTRIVSPIPSASRIESAAVLATCPSFPSRPRSDRGAADSRIATRGADRRRRGPGPSTPWPKSGCDRARARPPLPAPPSAARSRSSLRCRRPSRRAALSARRSRPSSSSADPDRASPSSRRCEPACRARARR